MRLILGIMVLLISIAMVSAEANLQVSSFSCSPTEVAINSVFSCTAQVTNTGDVAALLNTVTLYPDGNNWLESSNYPQSSGVTLNTSQSTEVNFLGLRATKSGNNGFSKIMLDNAERTDYVSTTKVNVINVAVGISNSASSAAMGGSVTSTVEVTAGGNINAILAFAVDSGGCSIGSQTNPVTFNGMTDGSKQSKVWTITQGTSGNCQFSVSASASGSGGIASKIDSTSSSITCTDCPVASSSASSGGGSGGSGGSGATVYDVGEITSSISKELAKNEKVKFNISGVEHKLTLLNITETTAVIKIESEAQTFTLAVKASVNVDLNKDNNADISVKLDTINLLTKKATFIITRLAGAGPVPDTAGGSVTGGVGDAKGTGGTGTTGTQGELAKSAGNLVYWIIGILIILIIIIIIIIVISRRGKSLTYRKKY